jgi:hypothetical protein
LRHSTSPVFCEGFIEIRSHELFAWGWLRTSILLISASWVARVTGVWSIHFKRQNNLKWHVETFPPYPLRFKKHHVDPTYSAYHQSVKGSSVASLYYYFFILIFCWLPCFHFPICSNCSSSWP